MCNAAVLCLVYPVEEGPVFAMCMTNQGNQATLNQWISGLQQNNPILGQIPTLFLLDSGPRELQGVYSESGHQHRSDPGTQRQEPEEEPELIIEEELRKSQGMKR